MAYNEKASGMGRKPDQQAEKARLYRDRAEELRVMIPDMRDIIYAKLLEKIADDYDQRAAKHERESVRS